jgi:dimethylhistidine N-methyltransferase
VTEAADAGGSANGSGDPQFAIDVAQYLSRTPRQLPSRYFYDPLGSALFDAITHLPWYRIARAESRLLRQHGVGLHRRLDPLTTIVELGPGSGEKLDILLDAADHGRPVDVHLVDVSHRALDAAAARLAGRRAVRAIVHAAEYSEGLHQVAAEVRGHGRTLALFLGSNIGNFDAPCAADLLRALRGQLSNGDALLIGADLVKPEPELLLAYDDPLGVTAAFNRNLLVRINRELGGEFDLEGFAHLAAWNAAHSRVEMHLVSRRRQTVRIRRIDLEFTMETGERIWTESSYKYRPDEIARLLEDAGFTTSAQWIDERDAFALTLAGAS